MTGPQISYRPHRFLSRLPTDDGDVLVGRAFSCAYVRMPSEATSYLFDNGLLTLESGKATQWAQIVTDCIEAGLLVDSSKNEVADLLARSSQDRLEEEVGTPGLWQMTRDFYFNFLLERGLKEQDRVLDLGCGNLRIGLPIIGYLDDRRYVGLDVRRNVLDMGKVAVEQAGLSSKSPTLLQTDAFNHPSLEGRLFDVVVAFQVLFHLTDEEVRRCFRAVIRQLRPDGVFFANVEYARAAEDEENPGRWKGFPFIRRRAEDYQQWAEDVGLQVEDLGPLTGLGYDSHAVGATNHMLSFRRSASNR